MRILFVVPNVPSPIRARPFNLIRRLSRSHEVSVLCIATNEADHRFIAELSRHCHELEIVRLSRWRSVWNCVIALFSGVSLRCAYFYSPVLRDRAKAKIAEERIDIVHAEHLKSVPMVQDALGQVPIVFDAVDCVSMFESRRRRVLRNPLLRVFSHMESKRMLRGEERAIELFDRVVISSPVDRDCYPTAQHMRKKLAIVPNGVDLDHFQFELYEPERSLIVFCAKLDYFPNEDAAMYFVKSVWPLLQKRRPSLRLDIVGSRPPPSVRRLHGNANIRVIASVADVRPYLGRAWVALCPIRAQAGTQNKILEAMALGVPVIATRICCPGLAVEAGKHLLVADTPDEFVCATERLLDDPVLRSELITAGRAFVERHHDWISCVKNLCDAYADAVSAFADHSTKAPCLI